MLPDDDDDAWETTDTLIIGTCTSMCSESVPHARLHRLERLTCPHTSAANDCAVQPYRRITQAKLRPHDLRTLPTLIMTTQHLLECVAIPPPPPTPDMRSAFSSTSIPIRIAFILDRFRMIRKELRIQRLISDARTRHILRQMLQFSANALLCVTNEDVDVVNKQLQQTQLHDALTDLLHAHNTDANTDEHDQYCAYAIMLSMEQPPLYLHKYVWNAAPFSKALSATHLYAAYRTRDARTFFHYYNQTFAHDDIAVSLLSHSLNVIRAHYIVIIHDTFQPKTFVDIDMIRHALQQQNASETVTFVQQTCRLNIVSKQSGHALATHHVNDEGSTLAMTIRTSAGDRLNIAEVNNGISEYEDTQARRHQLQWTRLCVNAAQTPAQ